MAYFPHLFLSSLLFLLSAAQDCSYWLEDAPHTGIASFSPNPGSYQVFRNVKDYGARGDGVTDDTAAINAAISAGNRCGQGCNSSSTTPATVYFPAGTYALSAPIIDLYYTNLVGNPNCLPVIKPLPSFVLTPGTIGIIDGDPYLAAGAYYISTNIFWRQVKNFIIDMTAVPASTPMTGIHWRTGQATSLQNIEFRMSQEAGTQHAGIFIEDGSGGFVNDLTFNGGLAGISVGNQQFTMRNLKFSNVVTAINQIWDWGWTYSGISIDNCSVGISASNGGAQGQLIGSINLIDSSISNTPIGITTSRDVGSLPVGAGVLNIENVDLSNVPVAIQGVNGKTVLEGTTSSTIISAWSQGNAYTPAGPQAIQGPITPNARPASLLAPDSTRFYSRSKPSYANLAFSTSFISARALGATGDGHTDDTAALNAAVAQAAASNKVLFLDHGNYLVTSTIHVPAGTRIAGEVYPVILATGAFFADAATPQPVVQVGQPGDVGAVELADLILSTRGPAPGAIMLEINLASPPGSPSGYWDVHTRLGGTAGSLLQLDACAATPGNASPRAECIAAFASVHIAPAAAGHYLENCWLWVADHDVEDALVRQISVYAGRGLLDESTRGPTWLVGTGVEHHALYQYAFRGTRDVFAGLIQTETAYYQPNPPAPAPFAPDARYGDPTVYPDGEGAGGTASGWGLRVVDSADVLVYGAGHYSFFNDNDVGCSNVDSGRRCQRAVVDVQGSSGKGVSVYGLATVGVEYMFTVDGVDGGYFGDNADGFTQTIGLLRF